MGHDGSMEVHGEYRDWLLVFGAESTKKLLLSSPPVNKKSQKSYTDTLKQSRQLFSTFYKTLFFQFLMGRVRRSVIGDI